MASLGDYHPAFAVPPAVGGCCTCLGNAPNECPAVLIEAKQCSGSFSKPGPCGIFNPDDETWYLSKTTTWSIQTRLVDPPPPTYSCEYISQPNSQPAHYTTFGTNTVEVPYVSMSKDTYTQNEDGGCDGPEHTETQSSYSIEGQVIRVYSQFDTNCTGAYNEIDGPNLEEVDPDSTDPVVTWGDPWQPMTSEEVIGKAQTEHNEDCAEAEWGNGSAFAQRSVSLEGEANDVAFASVVTAETRFYIAGGNTGYLHFRWAILDELGEEVDFGTETLQWDPTLPFETTVSGPAMDATPPNYAGGETLKSLQLVITEMTCEPPIA